MWDKVTEEAAASSLSRILKGVEKGLENWWRRRSHARFLHRLDPQLVLLPSRLGS